jgi:hypothetical protein
MKCKKIIWEDRIFAKQFVSYFTYKKLTLTLEVMFIALSTPIDKLSNVKLIF